MTERRCSTPGCPWRTLASLSWEGWVCDVCQLDADERKALRETLRRAQKTLGCGPYRETETRKAA